MTMGLAASGRRAGEAVLAAMAAAEVLGQGEIGGFAVLAGLTGDGRLLYATTQRGGSCGLRRDNEADVIAAIAGASRAAVITSGPDRPTPLTQFLPGAVGVGLVTGHRLPSVAGPDGTPLNAAVFARLEAGEAPEAAVAAVLATAAENDAGLIALSADGRLALRNSARVSRRPDLGVFEARGEGWSVGLLHNSITSDVPYAEAIGGVARAALGGGEGPVGLLTFGAPVPIVAAATDRVQVDSAGRILVIETANPALPTARRRGGAIYLGSTVVCDGRVVGVTASERVVDMADGTVVAVPDDTPAVIAMRRTPA